MLDMNLRELILCAHLQPAALKPELLEAVRERIKSHPEEVNQPGLQGFTPCHLAVMASHAQLIEVLVLEGQGDLFQESAQRHTPLSLATSEAMQEHLQRLKRKKPLKAELNDDSLPEVRSARTLTRSARRSMIPQEREITTTPRISQLPKLKQIAEFDDALSSDDEVTALVAKTAELEIKEREKSGLYHYVEPLLKSVNADRENLVKMYLEEGFCIESLDRWFDCGLLAYSYREGLSNIFSLLMTQDRSIRNDSFFNQQRVQHVQLLSMAHRRQMLLRSQNIILEKLEWNEIKKIRTEIVKLSSNYNELLNQYGLEQKMPPQDFASVSPDRLKELAVAKKLPQALLNSVFSMISCVDGTHPFVPEDIANQVAGLCAKYPPLDIMMALVVLQPECAKAQKLILFYVFKEIITHNTELSSRDLKLIATLILPAIQTKSAFKELIDVLRFILMLRYKTRHELVDNYFFLESLIRKYFRLAGLHIVRLQFKVVDESGKRASHIAEGLRAYSLMLYHNLNIKELSQMGWRAHNKEELAPSVCDIENYFNGLSNWVTSQILQYNDLKQRVRFLKMCIKVTHALIDSEVPDYTSAMAIFSAFNQASITRLKATSSLLRRKTKKLREKLEEHLSPHKNFLNVREVLERNPYAIPHIGVITADLTFAHENNDETSKNMIVGKVVRQLVQKKHHLELLHLPITYDVGAFVAQVKLASDDDLYQHSLALEPRPFQLTADTDFQVLLSDMATVKRNEDQLRVVLHGVSLEGKAALEPFTQWLKERYIQGKLAIGTFADLVSLAHSIVEPDGHFKFNAAYYEQLTTPIVVQFRRSQRELQDPEPQEGMSNTSKKTEPKMEYRK